MMGHQTIVFNDRSKTGMEKYFKEVHFSKKMDGEYYGRDFTERVEHLDTRRKFFRDEIVEKKVMNSRDASSQINYLKETDGRIEFFDRPVQNEKIIINNRKEDLDQIPYYEPFYAPRESQREEEPVRAPKSVLIVKRLPSPDISVDDLELMVREDCSSRNSVFRGQEVRSRIDLVVKFYENLERAQREARVLSYLSQTPFADRLPKVIRQGDGFLVEQVEIPEPVGLLRRVRTLADLHELACDFRIPTKSADNVDELVEILSRLVNVNGLAQRYIEVDEMLNDSELVLTHGDAKPENWVGNVLIDWESAGKSYRERDLAKLMIDQRLSDDQIRKALMIYQSQINALRGEGFNQEEFERLQERFKAARFKEAVRKLRSNLLKKNPDENKLEYLTHLIQL